jgi:hypothetical protein
MEDCGSGPTACHKCCDILDIEGFDKPALTRCPHTLLGQGCAIYETRPVACRTFECTWLASQRGQGPNGEAWDRMPPEMRPDRCGVLFAPVDREKPDKRIHVHVDRHRPDAWQRRDVKTWIERIVGRGITVILYVGTKHTVLRAGSPNMRRSR